MSARSRIRRRLALRNLRRHMRRSLLSGSAMVLAMALLVFSRTIAEKVFHEKVAVLTTDAQTDGRFAEGASIIRLGIRSAMAAPIRSARALRSPSATLESMACR